MKVVVLHGKDLYELACEQDESVWDLMAKVKEASGVFERHQKLVFKGKKLDAQATLAQAKVKDGARIMLIASSVPLQTQVSRRISTSSTWFSGTYGSYIQDPVQHLLMFSAWVKPDADVLVQLSSKNSYILSSGTVCRE